MSRRYAKSMEKKHAKPTTMRLTDQGREAIEHIKALYACLSDIAAIRLALQVVARQEHAIAPHA